MPVPTIQTERLTLRALQRADAEDLQRVANNRNVARNLLEGFPHPYEIEHAIKWCEEESRDTEKFGYVWGIEFDSHIIGVVGGAQEKGWLRCTASVGWWIGEPYWGRGLTSEALAVVTPWFWAHLPEVVRLEANIFSWNTPSMNVAKKCGFLCEGELRLSAIKDGVVIDRTMWALYRPSQS